MAVDIDSSGTAGSPSAGAAAAKAAAKALLVVSLALLTQFMLGIVVNLFVTVSKTHPGAGVADYLAGAARSVAWAVTSMWPFLALHVLLGLALVAGSLTFLVMGLRARRPARILVWNFAGALGALLAAGNGMYFLIHPDADWASLLMATGFAAALGSVITQLYLLRRAG